MPVWTNEPIEEGEDGGMEDEPWPHVEGMWKTSEEEKTFWAEAQQCFDEKSFGQMQKKRIAGVPFDFFMLREEIKEAGYNPRMPGFSGDGGQRLKHCFAKGKVLHLLMATLCAQLWNRMRSKNVEGAQAHQPGISLKYAYTTFIAPLEKQLHFSRLPPLGQAKARANNQDDVEVEQHWLVDKHAHLSTGLLDGIQEIKILAQGPSLSVDEDGVRMDAIVLELNRLGSKLENIQSGHGEPAAISIVGRNRIGKSFTLNQILALTEIPAMMYNRNNQSVAEDAAHVATRMYMERFNTAEEQAPDEEINARHRLFLERVLDVGVIDGQHRQRCEPVPSKLSAVRWVIPNVSGHADSEFDPNGKIRKDNDRFKDTHDNAVDAVVDKAFDEYAFESTGRAPRKELAEFLLPSSDSTESVTGHNTFVWGGERYGLVVEYATELKIKRQIDDIQGSQPDDHQLTLIKKLLHQLHPLQHGITQPGWTSEQVENFDNKKEDYMDNFKTVKALMTKGGPGHWWLTQGSKMDDKRVCHHVHESARSWFNQIVIHQGAGNHLFDDRIYIKTVLAELINASHEPAERRQTAMAALINEVHLTVPSVELNRHTALVDTPGANDVDPVKFVQLRDAVERSSGFFVQLAGVLKADASTVDALKVHGIFERVIKSWSAGDRRKDDILFLHSYEKDRFDRVGAPRPRSEDDEASLMHPDQMKRRNAEAEKECNSIKATVTKVVMDLLEDGLRVKIKEGGQMFELSKATFPYPDDRRNQVRLHFATQMANHRSRQAAVAIYRAIVRSGRDEPWLEKCQTAAGFGAVLDDLRKMLRGSVTAKEVCDFAELCTTMSQRVAARPVVVVDQAIRDRATDLEKKPARGKKLRLTIRKFVEQRCALHQQELKNKDHPFQDWVGSAVDQILDALGSVKEVFKNCDSNNALVANTARSDIQRVIKKAAEGTLFAAKNAMSTSAFTHCHQAFGTLDLWGTVFKGQIEDTLKHIRDNHLQDFYSKTLKLDMAGSTAGAIIEVLKASFNCHTKVNAVQQAFFRETKHFSGTIWKFFRDSPKDSVPQTVLNLLFKGLFSELAEGDDVFDQGRRGRKEVRAELDAIFSKDNLAKHKQELRGILLAEIVKLMADKVYPALMKIFETTRGAKPSGRNITKIVKQAYRDVAASTKIGDQQGADKVRKFKQLCEQACVTCEKLEELESSSGQQDTLLVKCIRATAKLDRFLADCTRLPEAREMKLLKSFNVKVKRKGYPVDDPRWTTWKDIPGDTASFKLAQGPALLPPDQVMKDSLPKELIKTIANRKATLIAAKPLTAETQICAVLSKLFLEAVDVSATCRTADETEAEYVLEGFTKFMDLEMGVRAAMLPRLERVPEGERARYQVRAFLETFADIFKANLELYFVRAGKGLLDGVSRPNVVHLIWDEETKMLFLVKPVPQVVRLGGVEAKEVANCLEKVDHVPPEDLSYWRQKQEDNRFYQEVTHHSRTGKFIPVRNADTGKWEQEWESNQKRKIDKSTKEGEMSPQPRGDHQSEGAINIAAARAAKQRKTVMQNPDKRKRERSSRPPSPPAAQRPRTAAASSARSRSRDRQSRSSSPGGPTPDMMQMLEDAAGNRKK